MNRVGNIDPLIGRHYVTKSGIIFRVEKLGEGAIRIHSQGSKPSEADHAEFKSWAESVLGYSMNITDIDGRDRDVETREHLKWRREHGI